MRVAIGSDHAGYPLKEALREQVQGVELVDFGTHSEASCDYPDIARAVAAAVARGDVERGILICGTGVGMSIAANKVAGVRAAACSDTFSARLSREHNDTNVLCIGARVLGCGLALDIVDLFLQTAFDGGERHVRRIQKMQVDERQPTEAGG